MKMRSKNDRMADLAGAAQKAGRIGADEIEKLMDKDKAEALLTAIGELVVERQINGATMWSAVSALLSTETWSTDKMHVAFNMATFIEMVNRTHAQLRRYGVNEDQSNLDEAMARMEADTERRSFLHRRPAGRGAPIDAAGEAAPIRDMTVLEAHVPEGVDPAAIDALVRQRLAELQAEIQALGEKRRH